ncbi:MAG TPA: glycosyltransferase family 4 protein [Candidatus Binataceae bacterium]|nr:glycosyltransferase family 4 protein [Candidatus Binataceae bacterium]
MRLLFLNPNGSIGGAERSLLEMLGALRRAQPELTIGLLVTDEGPLVEQARALGIEATPLPLAARLAGIGDWNAGPSEVLGKLLKLVGALPALLAYRPRLQEAIGKWQPDLVHANGFKAHLLAAIATPVQVPLIWHLHDYPGRRRLMARLLKLWGARCSLLIANSRSVARDAGRVLGPRVKSVVVHNGVDLNRFSPCGPVLDLDNLAGLPPGNDVRIGLIATLARWKGHEVFLRALAALPNSLAVRGYVIGGPIYHTTGSQTDLARLRALAAQLGLQGRVGFTGHVDDPAAALRALDIVVHASTDPEPFGMAIAEAMACGRALVVSAAGGAAEIISAGHDALIHRPGDAAGLATQLERLARDGALRQMLAQTSRASALRRFDSRRMAREMIQHYRELAGLPPATIADSAIRGTL